LGAVHREAVVAALGEFWGEGSGHTRRALDEVGNTIEDLPLGVDGAVDDRLRSRL
jgi:hypothetical protein